MPKAITEVEEDIQDDYVWLFINIVVIIILVLFIVYRFTIGKRGSSNLTSVLYIILIDIAIFLLSFQSPELCFLALVIYFIYLHYCHKKGYI